MEEKKKRSYYNREHQARYQASHQKKYYLTLHTTKDADIIETLDAQESKMAYIKQAIRNEIKREGL